MVDIPQYLNALLPQTHISMMCSDSPVHDVRILSLRESFLKKFTDSTSDVDAEKAALDLFLQSNELCSKWEPNEQSYHFDTLKRARDRLVVKLELDLQRPRLALENFLPNLATGPGSSIGTKHTDLVRKLFSSKMTTYDPALWEYYMANAPGSWKLAHKAARPEHTGCLQVTGSRMTFAKKNRTIARVINTEASTEMLFQLGAATVIEDVLLKFYNIDLSKQPEVNRYAARIGSLYGNFCTIDLKSASDRISDRFVRWLLPERQYLALKKIAAKKISIPNGTEVDLSIFSTMGNGFTFALQTLIFATIVEAAYIELGLPVHSSGKCLPFSVFGDDIICVKDAYHKVVELLEWCGFTVNRDKSFSTGSFRESCGSDFFKGHLVRGVYLRKLSHETHYISVFNRMVRWSCRSGVDITAFLRYLLGHISENDYVPLDESDIAGIKVPSCFVVGDRYKCYVASPRKLDTRDLEDNPQALYVGALSGHLNGTGQLADTCTTGKLRYDSVFKPMQNVLTGSSSVRDRPNGPPRLKRAWKSSPSWDWIPQAGLTTLDYELVLTHVL